MTFAQIFYLSKQLLNWLLFLILCLIWGSSFMLMKWGMYDANQQPVLSPFDVAALRMLSSGLVMLPFLPAALRKMPKGSWKAVLLSGWLGSFFPAFLFTIAETKIDGALAGSLNALTPLFVIITGALFFQVKTNRQKLTGVLVGFAGCMLLTYANTNRSLGYVAYTGFVLLATLLYGINVNMVQQKLRNVGSLHIAAVAFTGLIPPALIVLFFSGYFHLPLTEEKYMLGTSASAVLGILGTAIASIMFYMLVKRAGGLFASLVTYGVPFVAIGWGIYYNEHITLMHVAALVV
ncbi:MAG TPA: permease, partial [Chitinophagaceae bacterium]|nr:permease [Chitinophagaceae bacterium]